MIIDRDYPAFPVPLQTDVRGDSFGGTIGITIAQYVQIEILKGLCSRTGEAINAPSVVTRSREITEELLKTW